MDVGASSRTGLRRDRRCSTAARGRKQRAVFALLALQVNTSVALDRLVDEFWRDEPPAQATLSLAVLHFSSAPHHPTPSQRTTGRTEVQRT